jgi:hypothetical protein
MTTRKKSTTTRRTRKPAAKKEAVVKDAPLKEVDEAPKGEIKDEGGELIEANVPEKPEETAQEEILAMLQDDDAELPQEPVKDELKPEHQELLNTSAEALNDARRSPEAADVAAKERRAGLNYQYGATAAAQGSSSAQLLTPIFNRLLKELVTQMIAKHTPGQWKIKTNLEAFHVFAIRHFGHVAGDAPVVAVNFDINLKGGPDWAQDIDLEAVGLVADGEFVIGEGKEVGEVNATLTPLDLQGALPRDGLAYAPFPPFSGRGEPRGLYLSRDISFDLK